MAKVDHLIIGSGINALVAAAMLSKKGDSVLVIEREDRVGGCMFTSNEVTLPGYHHDVMAATFVLFMTGPAQEALGADQGIRLMYRDSQIAERIINHFSEREIPVLCIHDSFIIDHRHSMQLRDFMQAVTRDLFGMTFALSQDYAGIDLFMSNPENRIEQYIQHRSFPPYSPGYIHREQRFLERQEREM